MSREGEIVMQAPLGSLQQAGLGDARLRFCQAKLSWARMGQLWPSSLHQHEKGTSPRGATL